ncbi:hypothetical protein IQ260_18765 [Leptolyngbya cf. ectocarpi LEGE 11479]|uniref:Uncharacterized protein n=1 Tax=Leptolyngbya cf. ectocarpi LEGE 11479 TaxID=1828722 RepID=A0A929FAY4_LEPEC|nr:hypothetical protein [Leptolyngbya ectocarpi]MBE9068692.1 hypothetical protein [Leptolyngbya cf. ectocarpi LEGE 11479]
MKQLSVSISHLVRLMRSAAGAIIVLGYAPSVLAQTAPGPVVPAIPDPASLARLAADLSYPNSAQRFFEAGRTRFEQEIQGLSQEKQPSEPLLTVKPEVLKQFDD